MEIDFKELQKQRKEEMIKSGQYARVEIVTKRENGQEESIPYCETNLNNCTTTDVMDLLATMDSVKKMLIKKVPQAALYKLLIGNEIIGDIDITPQEE